MVAAGIAGIIVFLVYGVVTVLFLHFVGARRPILAMQIIFLACCPLAALAIGPLQRLGLDEYRWAGSATILYAGFLFAGLTYGYIQIFSFLERSITVEMLVRILHSGKGSMTLPELERVYPFVEVLSRKIRSTEEMGVLERVERSGQDLYRNKPLGQFVGRFFFWLKSFLNWGLGG
jgi:hypothetical protein